MSEQQATANITVSAAIRQALDAGCETTAAIVGHVQGLTGKIPAASTISVIRRAAGKPLNNGRGRPLKRVSPAVQYAQVTGAGESSPAPVAIARKARNLPAVKAVANKPVASVIAQLDDVTAQDFIDISKFLKPHVSKYGLDKVVHVVSAGCSM